VNPLSASPGARELRRAAFEFNCLPAGYAHASWYGTEGHAVRLGALKSPAALTTASRWLLERHGLVNLYDFDTTTLLKRIAWLEPAVLRRLAMAIGGLRHRAALRRCVDGGLQTLTAELGLATVRCILSEQFERTPLPAATQRLDSRQDQSLVPGLLHSGAPWLFALWPPAWRAIRARVVLKFERGLDIGDERPDEGDRSALALCVQSLLRSLDQP
jgi:hypothetical protein